MKLVLITILLLSIARNQTLACPLNNHGTQLSGGNEIELDVLGMNPVNLQLEIDRQQNFPDSFKQSTPQVKVTDQYSGFDCTATSIKLLADHGTLEKECWEIQITWGPGADQSGCKVEVLYPQSKSSSIVHLYMNY